MKKILCICLVLAFVVSLAGCGNSGEQSGGQGSTVSNQRGETVPLNTSNDQTIPEDPQLTAQGYPPLRKNLQEMYLEVEPIMWAFTLCQFQVDESQSVNLNGMTYHPIIDQRYPTYTQFREYLAKYFTDEYIDNELLGPNSCVQKGEEDVALMVAASGTDDVTYAGHVFTVTTQNDQTIEFVATVYYAADAYSGAYFYTTPSNAGAFTTKQLTYKLEMTPNGWRYAAYPYMRG